MDKPLISEPTLDKINQHIIISIKIRAYLISQKMTYLIFTLVQDCRDFRPLHDAALSQCEELKDRFVIMDLHGGSVSMSDPNWSDLVSLNRGRG